MAFCLLKHPRGIVNSRRTAVMFAAVWEEENVKCPQGEKTESTQSPRRPRSDVPCFTGRCLSLVAKARVIRGVRVGFPADWLRRGHLRDLRQVARQNDQIRGRVAVVGTHESFVDTSGSWQHSSSSPPAVTGTVISLVRTAPEDPADAGHPQHFVPRRRIPQAACCVPGSRIGPMTPRPEDGIDIAPLMAA